MRFTDQIIKFAATACFITGMFINNSHGQSEWVLRGPMNGGSLAFGNNVFVALGYKSTVFTSSDGFTWTSKDIGVTNTYMTSIKFLNGEFIITGAGEVITSPDGNSWSIHKIGDTLSCVTYGDSGFVGVGNSGRIHISRDGVTWEYSDQPIAKRFYSIAYGNNTYLAVSGNKIISSTDGRRWKVDSIWKSYDLMYMVYGESLFVAVGSDDGTHGKVWTSKDGVKWDEHSSGTNYILRTIFFDNNMFVVGSEYSVIANSSDGIEWSASTKGPYNDDITGITFGKGYFLAIGYDGTYWKSNDGVNWTYGYIGSVDNLNSIAWGNGEYLAAGQNGTVISSVDGATWKLKPKYTTGELQNLTFGNGLFMALERGVGGIVSSNVVTSPDGAEWTDRGEMFGSIIFNGDKFLVWSSDSVHKSVDGVDWTKARIGVDASVSCACYGNGQYVVVISRPGHILTSSDGLEWTDHPLNIDDTLISVVYGGNQYVAVGYNGAVYNSTDALQWKKRESSTARDLLCVNYGCNRFFAVGEAGKILVSFDGINWIDKSIATTYRFKSVICRDSLAIVCGERGEIYSSHVDQTGKIVSEKSDTRSTGKIRIAINGDRIICRLHQGIKDENARVEIVTLSGKKQRSSLLKVENGVVALSAKGLANGVYFISILLRKGGKYYSSFTIY